MTFRQVVFLFVLLFAASASFAQTAPNLENGWKPYGTYDGSHLDTVNLMNGNLMLHAPVLPDIPQRGGKISIPEFLFQTSKNWQVTCKADPQAPTGQDCWWQPSVQGFTTGPAVAPGGAFLQTTMGLVVSRTIERSG